MKKHWTLATAFLIAGCASKSKYPSSTEADALRSKVYLESVQAVGASSESGRTACPKDEKTWKTLGWKKLMAYTNACVLSHDDASAEKLANALATMDPLSPWGPYYLSVIAENRKELPRALWMIELALKKAPKSALVQYQRGRVQFAMGETAQAIQSFRTVTQLDPQFTEANLAVGHILFREQYKSEALPFLERALEHDRHNLDALVAAAECQLDRSDFKKASQYLTRARDLAPQRTGVHLKLAEIQEEKLHDFSGALDSYRRIKSLMGRRKLDETVSVNVEEKINKLQVLVSQSEAIAARSERGPATTETQKRVTK